MLEWLNSPVFWFAVAILLGVTEMFVTTLFFVWFSVAALVVMLMSFFPIPSWVLLAVWAVLSLILALSTRQLTKNWMSQGRGQDLSPTGRRGLVTKDVNPTGTVEVEGVEWSAKSESDAILAGTWVEVLSQDGAFLIVRPWMEKS